MLRYIVLVSVMDDGAMNRVLKQVRERLSDDRSSVWASAFDNGRVHVLCAGARAPNLVTRVANNGVILGHIFEGFPNASPRTGCVINDAAASRIVRSHGRELVRAFWGNYVSVLHENGPQRCTWVLRGPASSLPCWRIAYCGVEILFSMAEDYIRLAVGPLSIDWDLVALSLISRVPGRQTGLTEISEIQAGECVEFAPGGSKTTVYWDAYSAARSDCIEDTEEAKQALRDAVSGSVHAWASLHPRILLTMSGGLDSSIVLACLKSAPTQPEVTCFTEYSPGPDSDEREYARLIANHGRPSKLLEHRRRADVDLELLLQSVRSPIPQFIVRRAELASIEAEYVRTSGATAVFSGTGGDAVFYQHPLELVPSDFVHRHGLHPRLLSIAYPIAQTELLSLWKVLDDAVNYRRRRRTYDVQADVLHRRQLINKRVLEVWRSRQRPADAPEIRFSTCLGPAKLRHAASVSIWDGYYDPLGNLNSSVARIQPLLSQPVLEVALKIPTYVLSANGWDRGLARHAFARDLPVQIAWRREKGGIDEHMRDLLQANLPFVRRMLSDGLLMQNGLLDADRIAPALSNCPDQIETPSTVEVYTALCTEVWLRRWIDVADGQRQGSANNHRASAKAVAHL